MLYTVSSVAAELGLSRQRVHQIMDALAVRPPLIGGVRLLSAADRRRLIARTPGRPGRPRTRPTSARPDNGTPDPA